MPAQDDYETLQGLAERLGLDEKESDSFISSSMQRLGYKPKVQWDEPEDEGNSGGDRGDFFSGRRQQRQQRDVGNGRQQQQQRRASGGSFYE